jgi:hypothetical protein
LLLALQDFSVKWVLAGLKALLEHGIELNLIGDAFPKALNEH